MRPGRHRPRVLCRLVAQMPKKQGAVLDLERATSSHAVRHGLLLLLKRKPHQSGGSYIRQLAWLTDAAWELHTYPSLPTLPLPSGRRQLASPAAALYMEGQAFLQAALASDRHGAPFDQLLAGKPVTGQAGPSFARQPLCLEGRCSKASALTLFVKAAVSIGVRYMDASRHSAGGIGAMVRSAQLRLAPPMTLLYSCYRWRIERWWPREHALMDAEREWFYSKAGSVDSVCLPHWSQRQQVEWLAASANAT